MTAARQEHILTFIKLVDKNEMVDFHNTGSCWHPSIKRKNLATMNIFFNLPDDADLLNKNNNIFITVHLKNSYKCQIHNDWGGLRHFLSSS